MNWILISCSFECFQFQQKKVIHIFKTQSFQKSAKKSGCDIWFSWFEKNSKNYLKKFIFFFQKSSFKKNDTSRFARFSDILYIWTWSLQRYAFQYHIDGARMPKRAPKMPHDLIGFEGKHETNSNPSLRRCCYFFACTMPCAGSARINFF